MISVHLCTRLRFSRTLSLPYLYSSWNSYDRELKHDSLRVGQHTALWIKSKETQNYSHIQWSHLWIWPSRCFFDCLNSHWTDEVMVQPASVLDSSQSLLSLVLTRYWFQMWKKMVVCCILCHSYNSVYYNSTNKVTKNLPLLQLSWYKVTGLSHLQGIDLLKEWGIANNFVS